MATAPAITELHIADDPQVWTDLGFVVVDGRCRVGSVDLILTGPAAGDGITGWTWSGAAHPDFGAIKTAVVDDPVGPPSPPHPNGAVAMFYVVLMGPTYGEAVAALAAAGVTSSKPTVMGKGKRARLRSLAPAGGIEIEVIGSDEPDPERDWDLWGVIIEVADLDALAERLGSNLRSIKTAMQPHRRIATLDASAGSSVPIAFLSGEEPDGDTDDGWYEKD